jgi:hypothetical protein
MRATVIRVVDQLQDTRVVRVVIGQLRQTSVRFLSILVEQGVESLLVFAVTLVVGTASGHDTQ